MLGKYSVDRVNLRHVVRIFYRQYNANISVTPLEEYGDAEVE